MLAATVLAVALLVQFVVVDGHAHEWDQTEAMGQELVVQSRSVLVDLYDFDRHGGHMCYYYSPEGIRYCEIGVEQLELYCVEIYAINLNLWNLPPFLIDEIWVAYVGGLVNATRRAIELHLGILIELPIFFIFCIK